MREKNNPQNPHPYPHQKNPPLPLSPTPTSPQSLCIKKTSLPLLLSLRPPSPPQKKKTKFRVQRYLFLLYIARNENKEIANNESMKTKLNSLYDTISSVRKTSKDGNSPNCLTVKIKTQMWRAKTGKAMGKGKERRRRSREEKRREEERKRGREERKEGSLVHRFSLIHPYHILSPFHRPETINSSNNPLTPYPFPGLKKYATNTLSRTPSSTCVTRCLHECNFPFPSSPGEIPANQSPTFTTAHPSLGSTKPSFPVSGCLTLIPHSVPNTNVKVPPSVCVLSGLSASLALVGSNSSLRPVSVGRLSRWWSSRRAVPSRSRAEERALRRTIPAEWQLFETRVKRSV